MQRINGRDRLPVEGDHDVALAQAGPLGGTASDDGNDQHTAGRGQLVMPHRPAMQRHILSAYTDMTPAHFAFLDQPAGDVFGGVYADGKTEALRWEDHRRVHADNLTARIDQRPSGVSGVQRGVGLDNIVHQPARVGAERAAQGADNAGRHGTDRKSTRLKSSHGYISYAVF